MNAAGDHIMQKRRLMILNQPAYHLTEGVTNAFKQEFHAVLVVLVPARPYLPILVVPHRLDLRQRGRERLLPFDPPG